jgi:hypothetical protein
MDENQVGNHGGANAVNKEYNCPPPCRICGSCHRDHCPENMEGIPSTDTERAANYIRVNRLAAEGKLKLMTPKPTDLELQLFLAREYGAEIRIERWKYELYFHWTDQLEDNGLQREVSPREWDYICRKVEEKLTDEQKLEYRNSLCMNNFNVIFLSWTDRAIALRKVMGKEGV